LRGAGGFWRAGRRRRLPAQILENRLNDEIAAWPATNYVETFIFEQWFLVQQ
jgi:hypothetical protein